MIDLYFNNEIGATSNHEAGVKSVLMASKALRKVDRYISNYLHEDSARLTHIPIIKMPEGYNISFENIMAELGRKEKEDVIYLLTKFSKGQTFAVEVESDWELEDIGVSSNLLHHIAMNNGMVLTIATDDVWKRDFITFVGKDINIPNIWGQEDINEILKWVSAWIDTNQSKTDILWQKYKAIICMNCIKESDYDAGTWDIIFDKLRLVAEKEFKRDNDLIKKVGKTLVGSLNELIVTGSIRIFFSLAKGNILIGGNYQKGHGGESYAQNEAIKKAISKINAYCSNGFST